MEELLKLDKVRFLSSQSTLLESVSFSLKENQVLGLLGVNGAGKSTTLKICAGILVPTFGTISYAMPEPAKHIGYLPELPPLLAHWKVIDFLDHVAKLRQLANPKQAVERVIELCWLENILTKQNQQLSKGNQQRVALASAIIHQPSILILDEPTSGLDPQQIHNFRALIRYLANDCSVIFSTHIMQEAEQLCDEVVIIHQGKSTAHIAIQSLQQLVEFEFTQVVADEKLAMLPGWQSSNGNRHYFAFNDVADKSAVIRYCNENQLPLQDITLKTHQLEQAFLDNIGTEKPSAKSAVDKVEVEV